MEISIELNVSARYLYQRLLDTLIYDIKQETGKEPSFLELANIKYRKRLNRDTFAELKVVKLLQDQSYHVQIETKDYVRKEAYELHALDKDKVKVDYFEEEIAKQKQGNSLKMIDMVKEHVKRHNFIKVLKGLEIGY